MLHVEVDPEQLYNRQLFGLNPATENSSFMICNREVGDPFARGVIKKEFASVRVQIDRDLSYILGLLHDHSLDPQKLVIHSL